MDTLFCTLKVRSCNTFITVCQILGLALALPLFYHTLLVPSPPVNLIVNLNSSRLHSYELLPDDYLVVHKRDLVPLASQGSPYMGIKGIWFP